MVRLPIVFFAALAVLVGGADGALADAKGKKVALLMGPTQDRYLATYQKEFVAAAKKDGLQVTSFTSPFDAALQAQQMDDAIARKFDAIALQPLSDHAIIPAMQRAKQANIPVFLVIVPIEHDKDLFISYIGQDQRSLGRMTADTVGKALTANGRKGGKVALITGVMAEGVAPLRANAFNEEIKKFAGVQVVASEDGKWSPQLTEKIAGQLFARFATQGGLDALYGMNDPQAAAIVQAAEGANVKLGAKPGELVVVGSNCSGDGVRNIQAGKMYATNYAPPGPEAAEVANSVAGYFNGKAPPKEKYLRAFSLTKENVDKYAKVCGF
jgi:ribose transport system substrate-binding protein